jgi:amidohydrolase
LWLPTVLVLALLSPARISATPAPTPSPAGKFDKRIAAITSEIAPSLIEIRRDIHAHPELGFQETRTAGIVADYFRRLGLEVRTGVGKTGVIGVLRGGKPGPVVAMRGDMDCLPITEETGLPFASKEKAVVAGGEVGLMHACGHDVHTTLLLGVAGILSRLRADIPGTVVFIAQPSEEGPSGARAMIDDGAFKDVRPEAFFAYHVEDTIKAGDIKYCPGFMGANVDGVRLIVKSEGCHGAAPQNCVDPIAVGAQIVTALQVMVTREFDVRRDTLVTVGYFHAGAASNVIPETAELRATVRSYGDDQRAKLKERISRVITNLCEAAGAQFQLDYSFGTPALYNDPELTQAILPTVERVAGGKEHVILTQPEMGGEDFAFYSTIAPAVMLYLGVVPPDRTTDPLHSPGFVADESAIPVGLNVMAAVIMDYLAGQKPGRGR